MLSGNGYILIVRPEYQSQETKECRCIDFKDKKNIPNEFQFWCFNGKPQFVSAIFAPHGDNLKCTYNMDWERLPFVTSLPIYVDDLPRPKDFNKMVDATVALCSKTPFCRVDFLVYNQNVYWGEFTKFPAAGYVKWHPLDWDKKIGDYLNLKK